MFDKENFTQNPSESVTQEQTVSIQKSQIQYAGEFRHMYVDRYCLTPTPSRAVVMTTAFIENGYWYQIEKDGYSLAKRIAQEGFDVYVLSFEMTKDKLKARDLPHDSSFTDIVIHQLPKFHQQIAAQYEEIHYVGHSYGVTVLLAFLLGYTRKHNGAFAPQAEQAAQNTLNVKSFVSIAGLFKLTWPERAELPSFAALRTWLYPVLDTGARLPFGKVQSLFSKFPTGTLSYARYLPGGAPMQYFLSSLENVGLMPSFHFSNANWPVLRDALSRGCSDESLETFMTVLNLHPRNENSKGRKQALTHFTEDLENFTLPIFFIQGELDQVTHPDIIRRYGFKQVSSSKRKFTNLKFTGHQDILTARNANTLFGELKNWLASGIKSVP